MLASVQRITRIEPIANADNIVLAHLLGWQCIVQKYEFNEGDLCIYVEIDSLLPPNPRWDWLRSRCLKVLDGVEWYKIRTIKMKGVYSQGLVLPLSVVNRDLKEGDDVTKDLGIQKFEKNVFTGTTKDGKSGQAERFPGFLIKTDQTNVQNIQPWFDALKEIPFEVSIKIDGTSATYFWHENCFGVCSRKIWLSEPIDCSYWHIANKYNLQKLMPTIGQDIAIQGEIYGPGIQDNNERATEYQFAIFDILDIATQTYWKPDQVEMFCKEYHLPIVPIVQHYSPLGLFGSYDDLIRAASGPSVNPRRRREGLVFKSYGYDGQLPQHVWAKMLSRNVLVGQRLSFKVCALDYLSQEK